ncbi:hypothetical protein N0Q90_00925 (plasmid) [Sinorhizobium sp. M103]|nr:hypothetical protein [Sinorhizobium sp. M103]WEJ08773.1 hypothetical protein N0Q90_00925 [Sinorhizobium sp. M103]
MIDGQLEVKPHAGDMDPDRNIQNFPAALRHRARIGQPMARRAWLENARSWTIGANGMNWLS